MRTDLGGECSFYGGIATPNRERAIRADDREQAPILGSGASDSGLGYRGSVLLVLQLSCFHTWTRTIERDPENADKARLLWERVRSEV